MQDLQESFEKAVSDKKLSDIDVEYYYEGIQSQLDNLLSISSKKNYLKKFESKIDDENVELYEDEVNSIKDSMYSDIIDLICDALDFHADKNEIPVKKLVKTLYKFFVLEYTDNISYFLEMYILENKKDISKKLESMIPSPKRIEGIDSKIAIILNNMAEVIDIIAGDDISFSEYVEYINMYSDASASVNEILEYDRDGVIYDTDSIIKRIFSQLKNEEEGFGKIYTDLQLNIFNRFKSADL